MSGSHDGDARSAHERTRLLGFFEQAPSFMTIMRGPEHRFELANAAYRSLIGGRGEIIGRTVREVFPDLVGQGFFERLDEAYATGEPFVGEAVPIVLRSKPDQAPETRYLSFVYQPTRDERGAIDGILVVGHDVTALKRAQRMEAAVRLASGIAHDFNNLLAIIVGNVELLIEHLEADTYGRSLAQLISSAADRGTTLVSRLLAYSQRQRLDNRVVELGAVLEAMAPALRHLLGTNGTLTLEVARGLWPVRVDPAQIEIALVDLATNARDAMRRGGRLVLRADNVSISPNGEAAAQMGAPAGHAPLRGGDYVRIVVVDDGSGMMPEVLASAFEPFFTTKDFGHGAGLGLSMVQGFIEQSEGHVGVVSEPGRGTTVTLLLPRAPAPAIARSSAASSGGAPSDTTPPPTSNATRAHILVVDDEATMRRHVLTLLTRLGYDATVAATAEEALERMRAGERFDLLITDVIMPGGMNGRELADAACKLQADLRVLYTSGYPAEVLAERDGFAVEARHFLTKPYRKQELQARVEALLTA